MLNGWNVGNQRRCCLVRHIVIAVLLFVPLSCSRTAPDSEPPQAPEPTATRSEPVDQAVEAGRKTLAESARRAKQRRQIPESSATHLPSIGAPDDGEDRLSSGDAVANKPFRDTSASAQASGQSAPALPLVAMAQLEGTGIRRIDGKHLVLYTDLPATPQVDELPRIFDLAVPQWCAYFKVDVTHVAAWRMVGYLMKDPAPFRDAGMLPDGLPPFQHGYQVGPQMWMYEQPSDYYRRHMLLHEGTHAFMNWQLGSCGPPWYSEGMAELFGTHRWENGRLQLAYFPRRREDVPSLGRIKIVRDDVAAGHVMTLAQVMDYGPRAHLKTGPYGWCWAACALLDGNPQFQTQFRQLWHHVDLDTDAFRQMFDSLFSADRRALDEQWQLFEYRIDYGYDLVREAIVHADVKPLPDSGVGNLVIEADRGWQSTGFELHAGGVYSLEAAGRYQIARTSRIWWCEPDGVTIRYYAGQPLGRLLAAVVSTTWTPPKETDFTRPIPIGSRDELTCKQTGVLFLRVNDVPSELTDNAGQLRVVIRHMR